MIHDIIKGDEKFLIDDEILFNNQNQDIKNILTDNFNNELLLNTSYFDNCDVTILDTGRVIITYKMKSDEQI